MYLVTTTPTTEMAKLIKSSGLCCEGAWVPQVTNICLSATKLTYVFCISFCWVTMDLIVFLEKALKSANLSIYKIKTTRTKNMANLHHICTCEKFHLILHEAK